MMPPPAEHPKAPRSPATGPHESVAMWKGSLEPSFVVHCEISIPGTERKLVKTLGAKYGQGALLFYHGADGPDTVQRIGIASTSLADVAWAKMTEIGLPSGTYDPVNSEIRVVMHGREQLDALKVVSKQIGAPLLEEECGLWDMIDVGGDGCFGSVVRDLPYRVTVEIAAGPVISDRLDLFHRRLSGSTSREPSR